MTRLDGARELAHGSYVVSAWKPRAVYGQVSDQIGVGNALSSKFQFAWFHGRRTTYHVRLQLAVP
jgi:hypothetical protein